MQTRRVLGFFGAFTALALAAACHHTPRQVGPPPPPTPWPRSVAILPLANSTVSVDGPEVLRKHLANAFVNRGYQVQSMADTDERLRGIGITLGGQVAGAKLSELKSALGTDAVVAGTLTEHKNIVLVVENKQVLAAEIHMQDLLDEKTLYTASDKLEEGQGHNVTSGSTASKLISGAVGVASGVAKNGLDQISSHLAARLTGRLPHAGHGHEGFDAPAPPPPSK